jgi:hypothetical protein
VEEREVLQSQCSMRQHPPLHGGVLTPKKPLARFAVTSPFVLPIDGSSPDPLDSSEQETSSDGLLHSRGATQNHANRRILRQYALCSLTACLVDLTAIPDGQRIKGWRPDWANPQLLRDPGTRHPNVRVALASWWYPLRSLRVGKRSGCGDRQY